MKTSDTPNSPIRNSAIRTKMPSTTAGWQVSTTFEFDHWNQRRYACHANASQILVSVNGYPVLLWMSRSDVEADIRDHGEQPALMRALEAYRTGGKSEEGKS